MQKRFILAIDQSTSGTKAALIDNRGRILVKRSLGHKQYYPRPSWVEHDPLEIYANVKRLLNEIIKLRSLTKEDVLALSITNQRETVLAWDKKTSIPIYNAIVWQCRRTADYCSMLVKKGLEEKIINKTGLKVDPYFSATKIAWLFENVEAAKDLQKEGMLAIGTIDSWLIWRLTQGRVHATDHTNASRTMLYDISSNRWDEELLDVFGIDISSLPVIKSSDDLFGTTSGKELPGLEAPITGIIGDSQAALFGQRCFEVGMVKATYGTGTSILVNTGKKKISSRKGMLSAIAWVIAGTAEYAIEGIIHSTGDTLRWMKENLGIIDDYSEIDGMLEEIKDDEEEVYLVPAFVGLGFPYWDTEARGIITGLSRRTDKRHIIKAALESVGFQVKDALDFIKDESGISISELRADGGLTDNDFAMQFQADLLDIPVCKSDIKELSMMGSAYIAGLSTGIFKDRSFIESIGSKGKYFYPAANKAGISRKYRGWKKSVSKSLNT